MEAGEGEEGGAEEVAADGDVLTNQARVLLALAEQEDRSEKHGQEDHRVTSRLPALPHLPPIEPETEKIRAHTAVAVAAAG